MIYNIIFPLSRAHDCDAKTSIDMSTYVAQKHSQANARLWADEKYVCAR